jgi:hypothetical protein
MDMMDFDGQNIKLSHDQVIMMNIFIQNLSIVTYKYLQYLVIDQVTKMIILSRLNQWNRLITNGYVVQDLLIGNQKKITVDP